MRFYLTVSGRGLITLPSKARKLLGFKADNVLIAETTEDGLLLKPAVTLPIEMYSAKRIAEFDEGEAELQELYDQKIR